MAAKLGRTGLAPSLLLCCSILLLCTPACAAPAPPSNLRVSGSGVSAAAFFVSTDGNDNNTGTEAAPFRTLGRGVAALKPGQTLYVKAGTYTGSSQLWNIPSGASWDQPVTIAAYPGSHPVIASEAGEHTVRFVGNHHIIIDGFVIDGTGGNVGIKVTYGTSAADASHHIRIMNTEVRNAPGQGVLVTGPGVDYNEFLHVSVHDTGSGDFNHGFYITTNNNVIDGCESYRNGGWGLQVYNGTTGGSANNNIVRNSRFHDNARVGARGPGIGLYSGQGNMAYNNLVWNDHYGIMINYDAIDTKVYNNTVYNVIDDGIYVGQASTGTAVKNNIVFKSSGVDLSNYGVSTVASNNLLGIDPHFRSPSTGDFSLLSDSPAIDHAVSLPEVPLDIVSTLRPQGSLPDCGAYEYKL